MVHSVTETQIYTFKSKFNHGFSVGKQFIHVTFKKVWDGKTVVVMDEANTVIY